VIDTLTDHVAAQHERAIELQRALTAAEERFAVMRVSLMFVLEAAGITVSNDATDDELRYAAGKGISQINKFRKTHEQFASAIDSATSQEQQP
jgi:hypothetical protein